MTTQEFDIAVTAFVMAFRTGGTADKRMDNAYDEWLEENLDKFPDDDAEREFAQWKGGGERPRNCSDVAEVERLWRDYQSELTDRADDDEWTTINGTHVLIGENGEALSGGNLKGRNFSDAKKGNGSRATYKRPAAQDKKLRSIVRRTANLKNEQYRVVNPDGEVVFEKKGDNHSVYTTVGEKREHVEGNATIHNHPSGGTFSTADLNDFGHGATEIVVASPEGTYTLTNLRVGKPDQYSGWRPMQEALEKAVPKDVSYTVLLKQASESPRVKEATERANAISRQWLEARNAGASDEEIQDYYKKYDEAAGIAKRLRQEEIRRIETKPFHNFYKNNARKYGFEYKFEPRKRKDSREDGGVDPPKMKTGKNLLSQFWITGNKYLSEKLLDFITKSAIIRLYDEGARMDDDPESWITLENGAHVPLNESGRAVGGAGGWAKGKDFSKPKKDYEKGTVDKPSAKGENVPCTGFRNQFAAQRHEKHWPEFGFSSRREYEKAAIDFLKQPVGGDIDGYKRQEANGRIAIIRFNRKTGEMGIGFPGKEIKTYYKAKYYDGKVNLKLANKYFDRLKKEEAYEG